MPQSRRWTMDQRDTSYGASRPATIGVSHPITVLVVDDEEPVLAHARQLLESLRLTVCTARSTAEALQVVASGTIDLALVDWRLKARDDGLALGRLLCRDHGVPFVLFSGYLDTDATGSAYKLGAADVVDKPLRKARLATAVELALRRRPRSAASHDVPLVVPCGSDSVSERWAHLVLEACRALKDPSTEPAAAKAAGVSAGVFRETCRACGVGARQTRDLIRFMRAISRSQENATPLRIHLAIADPRTRARLFERAGLAVDSRSFDLHGFIMNQRFIPLATPCLQALAHQAANDPLFFAEFRQLDGKTPAEPGDRRGYRRLDRGDR